MVGLENSVNRILEFLLDLGGRLGFPRNGISFHFLIHKTNSLGRLRKLLNITRNFVDVFMDIVGTFFFLHIAGDGKD